MSYSKSPRDFLMKKMLDFYPFCGYVVCMTKSEIESNISHLHIHLQTADLSEGNKVALRNEIGRLEDKLALLEFREENEDIDYGYHDQYEF